ncbi:hypothetical protein TNCT_494381 [Trichonephila clavata]|uniref:Uncharacterized protein n=1 Tax=Trichonephila clavata TaxID=2740835 RepID=A0A8X6M5E5_TRICU|nr:hypothetical protein TNCT_494381 [Trichonephila clavata]
MMTVTLAIMFLQRCNRNQPQLWKAAAYNKSTRRSHYARLMQHKGQLMENQPTHEELGCFLSQLLALPVILSVIKDLSLFGTGAEAVRVNVMDSGSSFA